MERLELSQNYSPGSKSGASTNFATSASIFNRIIFFRGFVNIEKEKAE